MAEWHILVAVVWENSFEPGDPSLKQIRREPKLLAEKNEKERKKSGRRNKGVAHLEGSGQEAPHHIPLSLCEWGRLWDEHVALFSPRSRD